VKAASLKQIMQTAFSFTTLSASGIRFRTGPNGYKWVKGRQDIKYILVHLDNHAAPVNILGLPINLTHWPKCWGGHISILTCLWKVPSNAATMTIFPIFAISSQNSTMSGNCGDVST
jgi:hypothetical protein